MRQTLHLKIVHHFLHVRRKLMMCLMMKQIIFILQPMCNLIEYSDNCSDTSGSLWQFKKDEVPNNNVDLTVDNSQSFKYKATFVVKTANAINNTNRS